MNVKVFKNIVLRINITTTRGYHHSSNPNKERKCQTAENNLRSKIVKNKNVNMLLKYVRAHKGANPVKKFLYLCFNECYTVKLKTSRKDNGGKTLLKVQGLSFSLIWEIIP